MTSRDSIFQHVLLALPQRLTCEASGALVRIVFAYFWPEICGMDLDLLRDLLRTWVLSDTTQEHLGWYRRAIGANPSREPHIDNLPISGFKSQMFKDIIARVLKHEGERGKMQRWGEFGRKCLEEIFHAAQPSLALTIFPAPAVVVERVDSLDGLQHYFFPVGPHQAPYKRRDGRSDDEEIEFPYVRHHPLQLEGPPQKHAWVSPYDEEIKIRMLETELVNDACVARLEKFKSERKPTPHTDLSDEDLIALQNRWVAREPRDGLAHHSLSPRANIFHAAGLVVRIEYTCTHPISR